MTQQEEEGKLRQISRKYGFSEEARKEVLRWGWWVLVTGLAFGSVITFAVMRLLHL